MPDLSYLSEEARIKKVRQVVSEWVAAQMMGWPEELVGVSLAEQIEKKADATYRGITKNKDSTAILVYVSFPNWPTTYGIPFDVE